jgi:hypothetical protein
MAISAAMFRYRVFNRVYGWLRSRGGFDHVNQAAGEALKLDNETQPEVRDTWTGTRAIGHQEIVDMFGRSMEPVRPRHRDQEIVRTFGRSMEPDRTRERDHLPRLSRQARRAQRRVRKVRP